MKTSYDLGHLAVYNNLKAQMARQNLDSQSSFCLAAKHDMDMRWERREFTRAERPAVKGWSDCEQLIEDNFQLRLSHRQMISTYDSLLHRKYPNLVHPEE